MFTLIEKDPKPKRFIFAGTNEEARYWMGQYRMNPNEWAYIYSAEYLYGFRDAEYVRVGTWRKREDSLEIEQNLVVRKFKEISYA